jgi:tetratricopeptide (TPR) repeat protein/2-polyprenyl-3-methyl-5-hydroxy-6-metoxy-1,4-benzoquinol methylase
VKARPRQKPNKGVATQDVGQLFALAIRHHQAGQFREAEGLYRHILTIDAEHAHSLYHLGLIGIQVGRPDLGADMITKAVALNRRMPEWHYNLAFALSALGRGGDAIGHYRKALALKPDYIEALMNLGNALKAEGQLEQAIACYQRVISLRPAAMEACYNLANVWAEQGQWDKAAEAYERALALKPDFAEAHTNFGIVLSAQGRHAEAVISHQRALALNPHLIEAYVNLGKVLAGEGRFEEAAALYHQAAALNPDHAQSHNNLGVAQMAEGRVDAAIASFQRALVLKPDLSEAHNNLGIMLMAKGQTKQAADSFQRALTVMSDFIEAFNNLGRACMAERDIMQALRFLARALAIRETTETKKLYVECLKNIRTIPNAAEQRAFVVRALSEPWGRPSDIAQFACQLVIDNVAISASIAHTLKAWPRRLPLAELMDPATRRSVISDPLLHAVLAFGRVADAGLERFLTTLRAGLLEAAAGGGDVTDADELRFGCALAQQCFSNDYVFDVTEAEKAQADGLRRRLITALDAGAGVPLSWLIAVACYFPLHSMPSAEALRKRPWPDPVVQVLQQQVDEPAQEQQSRASIARVTAIADDVSLRVQEQYEENPYPRWTKTDPGQAPTTVDDFLRRLFPLGAFRPLGKRRDVDVLIAGCGTGQHSIEVAQRWKDARLLAVDLSLTSLSYAKRRTLELGIDGIDYAQADLLELGSLGRSFDVIEAAGVLHHLADPRAGWRVLSSLLRPNGLLFLGLYSEVARRDIVATRAFIAERGYRPTIDDIRRCRQELMDSADGSPMKNVIQTSDFGSTSECRDLLFHVQEHRTTLSDIKAALAENALTFLGFEIDPFVRRQYAARFPDDTAMTDLDCWAVFEREHPLTFARMYQFWAQKA